MALTPLDIHNKQFRRTIFKGYDIDEVDEFLDEVIRDYEALIKEGVQLREQVNSLKAQLEQYEQLEETLHKTLVVAQNSADELKASAEKEAELIVAAARQQAEQLLNEGKARVQQLIQEHEDLVRHSNFLRSQLKSTLRAQLDLLEQGEAPPVRALGRQG